MPGVTIDDVRAFASTLERAYEVTVRGRVKFRVGQIVFLAFSRDEELLGFAFPKADREMLVASDPETFLLPRAQDLRFHWAVVRLERIDEREMRELVLDAWALVVPQKLWRPRVAALLEEDGAGDGARGAAPLEEPAAGGEPAAMPARPRRQSRRSTAGGRHVPSRIAREGS